MKPAVWILLYICHELLHISIFSVQYSILLFSEGAIFAALKCTDNFYSFSYICFFFTQKTILPFFLTCDTTLSPCALSLPQDIVLDHTNVCCCLTVPWRCHSVAVYYFHNCNHPTVVCGYNRMSHISPFIMSTKQPQGLAIISSTVFYNPCASIQ